MLTAAVPLAAALLLAACTVLPEPFTAEETRTRIARDLHEVFANGTPVSGPIGLEEAMARAMKYNLDRQVELMNAAVAQSQLDLSQYDMLPRLAAQAGYAGRNNQNASSSQSVLTGRQSLEPSVSQDQDLFSTQLGVTWNLLDFGVSYIRARQLADRALVIEEQRRKVQHNIIQDVRIAYWRAVAGQRLLSRIDPLLDRVAAALAEAREAERRQLRPPLEALEYQRALLTTLDQLTALRRELVTAKIELSALINLRPGTEFSVVVPDEAALRPPTLRLRPAEMEQVALVNRPELMQEAYQARIGVAETRRVLLEMLPGLNLSVSGNYDSNSYLVNQSWASYGAGLAWNLMTLFQTPARYAYAEANLRLSEQRRAALSMAVLAQVNVAYLRFGQAVREFESARQLYSVEHRILQQYAAAGQAQRIGEIDVIRAEMSELLATLRRDAAFAAVQNAFGAMMVSIGADPVPEAVANHDIATLAQALRDTMQGWEDGVVRLHGGEPPAAAAPESPAPAPAEVPAAPDDPAGDGPAAAPAPVAAAPPGARGRGPG